MIRAAAATSSPPEFDVAIVGAGPTGLTTANLLGSMGVRTLLVERNPHTVQEPRAVSIDDESLRTMQSCGLVEQVVRDVALEYGSIYFGPSGKPFLRVRPTAREYGYPRRNAFQQPILEATLAEGARRFPSVDMRFGQTLERFEQADDRVTLVLRDEAGQESRVGTRFLAAADGGRSSVRKAIGATMRGSSFEERWLIVDLKQTSDPFRETRVFCDPHRPAISLPGPHRTRRYEIRLREEDKPDDIVRPERVRALLAERGLDAESPIARMRVYTFHARSADRWRQGRVFLMGDAAHLTPPFAGQGMNTGVRDAQNFAWKAAAVSRGLFDERLLETYEDERVPHAWSMIQLALRMGLVMAPRRPGVAWLTRALFRLLAIHPGARDYVTQMRFKPAPRFENGFLLKTAGGGKVGTLFPQPSVEISPSGRALLDDVLGTGFALVCVGEDGAPFFAKLSLHAVWQRLGARFVTVLPRDLAFASQGAGLSVRDADGFFDDRRGAFGGRCFVLRPDRYVAAEMRFDEIEAVSAAFEELCVKFGLGKVSTLDPAVRSVA